MPGCTGDELPADMCADGPALVSGTIVRVDGPATYSGPFNFSDQSVAEIQLLSHESLGSDIPAELVAMQTVRALSELPLSFCVAGDPAVLRSDLDYIVVVEIRQVEGQHMVGDLLSEYYHLVTPPALGEVVEVTGLEQCGTPGSGGFCTGQPTGAARLTSLPSAP